MYKELKPDIITLDITMPVMSGIEASEVIIEHDKNANIIFLSGLGDHRGLSKNIDAKIGRGNYNLLTKPFTKDKLHEILKDIS